MEDPEQAFVEYASSRTDEAGVLSTRSYPTIDPQCSTHIHGSINAITINPKQQIDSHDDEPIESEEEKKDSQENTNTNPSASPDPSVSFITDKVRTLNSFFESLGLAPQLSGTEFVCTKGDDGDVMFIEIVKKDDDSRKEEPESGGIEHWTCAYGKTYIDLNSPLNIMTRMMYNWIMRRKLDPMENSDRGVSNFTGRIKGMHVFVGKFTFVTDFMIVEDISSIIDPRLSQVVLGKPFVDISNMTHDPPEGVVRFTNRTDEIAYKIPHKIEQYNSLSDLKKEHTLYLTRRSLEFLRKFHWTILGGRFNRLSHVSSPLLSKPGEYYKNDRGYDPSDVAFIEWLRSKFFNYKTMDHYTMKALWIYWIRGDDEVELTDEESSDNDDEIAEVFRIDTNIFDYETPICSAFNEFNYLLKKGGWILNGGIFYPELTNCGKPTPLLGVRWYEALRDLNKSIEALRNKAIMEGSIKEDDESRYEQKRQWNTYTNYDDAYEINHEHNKSEELCEIQEQPVCNIKRYMMIKYSFNDDEEYVAVKEDEYDDLTVTRKESCRAYQEIFQIMDEGWMVTRAGKKSGS
ncbi:hypothetical protein Tco_0139567 [Tanacetum coccineum]